MVMNVFWENNNQRYEKSKRVVNGLVCFAAALLFISSGCATKEPVFFETTKPIDEYSMSLKYEFETNTEENLLQIEYKITPKGNDDLYNAVFLISLIESSSDVVHPSSNEFVKRYAPFFDPDGNMKISDSEAGLFLKRIQIEFSHMGINTVPVSQKDNTLSSYVSANAKKCVE